MSRSRVAFLLASLLLAVVVAGPSGQAAEASGTPVLYLDTERGPGTRNFTTFPPEAVEPVRVEAATIHRAAVVWEWQMDQVPADWVLAEGTEIRVVFTLADLDNIAPVTDPLENPDAIARHKVQVDLMHGFRSYTGLLQEDDSNMVGQGSKVFDTRFQGIGPTTEPVDLVVRANETATFDVSAGEFPSFGIRVMLTGTSGTVERPSILAGSASEAARIEVPTFPWEAYRSWELAERAEEECHARILQGGVCETPEANETSDGEEEAAPIGWMPLIVLPVAVAAWAASRRFSSPSRG